MYSLALTTGEVHTAEELIKSFKMMEKSSMGHSNVKAIIVYFRCITSRLTKIHLNSRMIFFKQIV